jgi:hypothetical protein
MVAHRLAFHPDGQALQSGLCTRRCSTWVWGEGKSGAG